jgi:flagellar basal body P-ring protein FlgI
MKEILMQKKEHIESKKFIALFMEKMNLKVNDMVRFLDVSANTIYNYRTMDDQEIPSKIKDKIFDLLKTDDFTEARQILSSITSQKRDEIASSINSLMRTTRLVSNEDTNIDSFSNKDGNLTSLNHLGSKVFVDALLYEINKVVQTEDDYDFISYIKKYKGL